MINYIIYKLVHTISEALPEPLREKLVTSLTAALYLKLANFWYVDVLNDVVVEVYTRVLIRDVFNITFSWEDKQGQHTLGIRFNIRPKVINIQIAELESLLHKKLTIDKDPLLLWGLQRYI